VLFPAIPATCRSGHVEGRAAAVVITAADRCPASSAACGHAPAFSRAAFAEFLSIAGRLEGLKPASMMGSLYRHSAAFHPRPGRRGTGSGVHPAMVLAQARACAVSVMAGNSRRSSIAAENSPRCS
jgi:hypothetical protein